MTTNTAPATIARAIDLGHGNVKLTRRAADGKIEPFEFPAIAQTALAKDFNLDNLPMTRTQTVLTEVHERLYYVGPDTPAMQQNVGGRELDSQYARGDRYIALMKGALAYMGESAIDVLTLGLPLSTYEREHARLAQIWTARHEVPIVGNPKAKRYVDVRRVIVMPQPIGAYAWALTQGKIRRDQGSVLIVDPGYFTLDWVVVTEGQALVQGRSGALQGGVSALIRILTMGLEKDVQRPLQSTAAIAAIELAWRRNKPVTLYGREYKLEKHLPQVEAAVEGMVADMVGRLGDYADIRQVVVAGGGAPTFLPALRAKLGEHVVALDHPEFANLRGFQSLAESNMRTATPAAVGAAA